MSYYLLLQRKKEKAEKTLEFLEKNDIGTVEVRNIIREIIKLHADKMYSWSDIIDN